MNIDTSVREFADILGESRIIHALSKLAEIEANRCQKKIGYIRQELIRFEKRFNMTSDTAWTKFENGELPDRCKFLGGCHQVCKREITLVRTAEQVYHK